MGEKGNSRYLKRLNAPLYFGVHRKNRAYVTKPSPGRHDLESCIPLSIAILDLSMADNNSEACKVIKSGSVEINGKTIKSPKYPIGIEDVIEVGGEVHKIGINNQGKISFTKLEKSSDSRLCKVVGKYKDKGGKIMLRLHDSTILPDKGGIEVNDSVIIKKGAIEKRLKLQEGAKCSVIDGVHVGTAGEIKSVIPGNMHKSRSLVVQSDSKKFETLVRNIMVTG